MAYNNQRPLAGSTTPDIDLYSLPSSSNVQQHPEQAYTFPSHPPPPTHGPPATTHAHAPEPPVSATSSFFHARTESRIGRSVLSHRPGVASVSEPSPPPSYGGAGYGSPAKLRREHAGSGRRSAKELFALLVFAGCVVVFFAALTGAGYDPSSASTLHTPSGHLSHAPTEGKPYPKDVHQPHGDTSHDQGEDLIPGSPDDHQLDEEHAAHHHPQDGELFPPAHPAEEGAEVHVGGVPLHGGAGERLSEEEQAKLVGVGAQGDGVRPLIPPDENDAPLHFVDEFEEEEEDEEEEDEEEEEERDPAAKQERDEQPTPTTPRSSEEEDEDDDEESEDDDEEDSDDRATDEQNPVALPDEEEEVEDQVALEQQRWLDRLRAEEKAALALAAKERERERGERYGEGLKLRRGRRRR